MTTLLEQAFLEAAKLPKDEQEQLAAWLLDELAADRSWEDAFARTSKPLAHLADEALAEWRSGRTEPLDSDQQ